MTSRTWPHWRHLPRDTRDTLFLLAVIAWTALPHLLHLPIWCALLCISVLLWRTQLALRNAPLPGKWVLGGVLLVALGLTQWSFHTLLGKQSGVALLLVLMALKTLELRARRDAFVVFFLGFFLVLTHFLYSQSLWVAAAMLVSVWGLLTGLVLAHMPSGIPSLQQAAKLSLRCAVLGTPIMVLLFVFFPRIGPLWGVPHDGRATTGLSGTMSMGSVAEVAQDERVALRLKFFGPVPSPEILYFRGPVLTHFDGNTWHAVNHDFMPPKRLENLRPHGPKLEYEITLEPTDLALLPMLEATPSLPELEGLSTWRRDDLSWATQRPVTERLRFTTAAYPNFNYGPLTPNEVGVSMAQLRLPQGYNPRLLAWANALVGRPEHLRSNASALALAVMQHIQTGGYHYTLSPGFYGENNPKGTLDEFWFDRRAGFCEHFAASFVVIMRAMNIPARVVTGYQGLDPQMQDGYHLVRMSYAHAWAEYWQPGAGWLRADPTAAVAPDRIERSRRLAPRPGAIASAIDAVDPRLWSGLRDLWETVDNRWNQWVLRYTRGQQMNLLKDWGIASPGWEDLAKLLVLSLSLLSLASAAWALWDRYRQDPWQRLHLALCKAWQRLGLDAQPHHTPRQMAALLQTRFGANASAPITQMLLTLEQQRYSRLASAKPSAKWWSDVSVQLRRLRVLARP
jgi:protein-glutamine gamma-glutamyltransferase